MSAQRAIALAIGALVIFALIAGFRLIGSPDHRRRAQIDARRVDAIISIATFVRGEGWPPRTLPANVPRASYLSGLLLPTIATAGYAYRRVDDNRFQVCAVFLEPSDDESDADYPHDRGRTCYGFDLRDPVGTAPSRNAGRGRGVLRTRARTS
jgi:hypothetical protein